MNTLTNRTVGELATEIPGAIRVFETWGIDYCCGGLTPVTEACQSAGRTVEELAMALAQSAVPPGPLARDWSKESLADLARFIIEAYHNYTREELDTVLALAEKVRGVHGHRHAEVVRVHELVQALAGDMRPHMLKEEQVLFPYVDQLEKAAAIGGPAPTPFFGTVKNPVRMMMLEHDAVGGLLRDLRATTTDYSVPDDGCFSYRELYRRLAELETRTHEHIHLENNVYFPSAVAMEDCAGDPATAMAGAVHGHGPCGCSH
ncbi:MAG TPA: iron-sulfur cluster repair di-iron protein [Thermoanaerobaculia bacterium]|nr:iron-sulfur cluster repair di-iron protein [Thermoanaerobaculia bacterium]